MGRRTFRRMSSTNVSSASRHPIIKKNTLQYASLILWLSIFSYFGEALRVFMSNLFGTACHEPGTVGWNKSRWTPCTTAPGDTEATGGALFADAPANMLGCFVMGLFVASDSIAADLPVAFLNANNRFQKWTTTHFAIRTGCCGSLTTFASWNAQMVIMICAGSGTVLGTQWVSALFGYLIGWMITIQAFCLGRDVAVALHRRTNPDLAKEADVLARAGKILVNRHLPDFERRYLYDVNELMQQEEEEEKMKHTDEKSCKEKDDNAEESKQNDNCSSSGGELEMGTSGTGEDSNQNGSQECSIAVPADHPQAQHIHFLKRWKETTSSHRKLQVHSTKSFTRELHEIEHTILVLDEMPGEDLMELAHNAGWAVDALQNWKLVSRQELDEDKTGKKTILEFSMLLVFLVGCAALLIWVAIVQDGTDAVSVTYRTTALSTILSPFGTLLRWQLSRLNGTIRKYPWLPLGTLLANMIASVISLLMAAASVRIDEDALLAISFVGAIKTGFMGSLSTVSTFVAETVELMRELPRHGWAYYYSIGSITLACILGVASYVWAVV